MEFNTPKNFKQGRLIANKYRVIDIVLLLASILFTVTSIVTYLQLEGKHVAVVLLLTVPVISILLLTIPHGIYHNYLVYLHVIFLYNKQEKHYIYKGVEYGNQHLSK